MRLVGSDYLGVTNAGSGAHHLHIPGLSAALAAKAV
jgi:hypothetical protein